MGEASVLAKEEMILAGMHVFEQVFQHIDPSAHMEAYFEDGDLVPADTRIALVTAPLNAILKGERTALNFLQRMSGIATTTKSYVEKVQAYNVKILDTRKTVPGLRFLDKYAVRMGGGQNHRFGLYDGILIKDNHIVAAGSIEAAVRMAKQKAPHSLRIQVEVETPEQANEALGAGAEAILADNMSPGKLRETVNVVNGRALVEASGGVTLESIEQIAQCGVDFISVGALTHSVKAVDLSLEMHPVPVSTATPGI
jgi:nicotinate-nucleotide pyrophosphorylase (carboxylating)